MIFDRFVHMCLVLMKILIANGYWQLHNGYVIDGVYPTYEYILMLMRNLPKIHSKKTHHQHSLLKFDLLTPHSAPITSRILGQLQHDPTNIE